VGFRYASGDVDLRVQAPVLQVGADDTLEQIRFNTRSCVPPAGSDSDDWYRAYRELGRMLRDPAFERRLRLAPGDALVVDNLRVLHGRTRLHSAGTRHLQGCYADQDGLRSTVRVLRARHAGTLEDATRSATISWTRSSTSSPA